jgi:uncharacterized protein YceH (UPF0502 family)
MDVQDKNLPVLSPEEVRVLGSLIEKSKTTPEYYPMTVNGLTAACNQKTSRKPVVQYDEQTVVLTLDSLKRKGLVSTVTGGSSRTVKYKQNLATVYQLMPEEMAIIGLLLLRGGQTPGELKTNAGRMYEFDSLEEVQEVLERLMTGTAPFVLQLPRKPGQKEVRYVHLLSGQPDLTQEEVYDESPRPAYAELESRVSRLEQELSSLKSAFESLMKELNG